MLIGEASSPGAGPHSWVGKMMACGGRSGSSATVYGAGPRTTATSPRLSRSTWLVRSQAWPWTRRHRRERRLHRGPGQEVTPRGSGPEPGPGDLLRDPVPVQVGRDPAEVERPAR